MAAEMATKCPECGSKNIITDPKSYEVYCGNCGLVIEENPIDLGQEWRAYTPEQYRERARIGAFLYPDSAKDLGTFITPSFNPENYKLTKTHRRTLRKKGPEKKP